MAPMTILDAPVNPGDQLDHYQILSVVVQSPVATLFRATDLRTNREVAIKVPNPEMESDPTFADRFRREQEIAKRLDHPGIMKVISDADRTKPYIVMEWFEGKPLRQILEAEKKIEPGRAVRIAVAICNALDYIHAQGVVHGDLRPENILVDATDRIQLFDFGGAVKATARRFTFTKLSQLVGTSEYVSPEELKGKRGDARSDIYSLGIILYEMLTGSLPFPGSEPFARVSMNPVPPREIDPEISPQLQEVIYRALEKEPPNRYSTAHEFAHDLEHLDQIAVSDRPELRDWKKRPSLPLRKVFFYGAVALIPIAILGLILYFARHISLRLP
jgi:serine/threonine protein kinase